MGLTDKLSHEKFIPEEYIYKDQLANSRQPTHLHIREEEINGEVRKVAYDDAGNRFGTVSRDSHDNFADTFTLRFAIAHDGNLRAVIDTSTIE